MDARRTMRRTAYRVALDLFRRLPPRGRRIAVRLGTPQYTVGAVCALVREDTVLLLRQRHRNGWSLPGGLLDRGEDSDTAVARELAEELRLDLDPGRPAATLVDPVVRRVDVIYRMDAPADLDPRPRGEALELAWVRPEDLDEESAETAQILARLRQARNGAL